MSASVTQQKEKRSCDINWALFKEIIKHTNTFILYLGVVVIVW